MAYLTSLSVTVHEKQDILRLYCEECVTYYSQHADMVDVTTPDICPECGSNVPITSENTFWATDATTHKITTPDPDFETVIAEIRHTIGYDFECPRCGTTSRLTGEMADSIETTGMGEFECRHCNYREMVYDDEVTDGYDTITLGNDRQVGLDA